MHDDTDLTEFVTFTVAGQMFGLPISRVQDVFKPSRITRVPLAGAQIAGVLNLRGRIVTAIDMRQRIEAEQRENEASPMAIGIEAKGESFGLLVDAVGEVLSLQDVEREPNPINLGGNLAALSDGVPSRWRRLNVHKAVHCGGCARQAWSGDNEDVFNRRRLQCHP
jgi:purine-binding chemotaxis protein CheW